MHLTSSQKGQTPEGSLLPVQALRRSETRDAGRILETFNLRSFTIFASPQKPAARPRLNLSPGTIRNRISSQITSRQKEI